ncbi:MAG: site-2 protease family protein [Myxococcales bacterium]|nr:site-2 protease family protein [Myxococcales bacterium]
MLKSWRLGRVFGFPVEINLSFLLLLAVVFIAFGGVTGVLFVGIAFASVLLHELGHALVARRLDVHVSGIELSFFGGAAKMVDMPRSAKHEIAIAAAGPAGSLALAGLGLGLGGALHAPLLATIGWINLGLAIFNMIPALPMDGGRILRALLTYKMDFVRATDISVTVSRVVAVGFAILGVLGTYQLLLLAPLLWMMGTRERAMARAMGNPYAGYRYGGGRGGRGDPFDDSPRGPRPGGFYRDAEIPVRRFTVRQVRGRLVIEAFE